MQRSQRFFLDAELKSMVCDSSDDSTDESDPECSHRPQVLWACAYLFRFSSCIISFFSRKEIASSFGFFISLFYISVVVSINLHEKSKKNAI